MSTLTQNHPNIKLIFEHEYNNSFSFVDVKICRENNKLTTFVYRKPTFSGVFTNFKSFMLTVYKFSLVYILLHRCFNVTSSYKKFHNEKNALKQIFRLDGYPIGLVFLLFLCRTENLIIQWALENVLIEICHVFNIYYSGIGAS